MRHIKVFDLNVAEFVGRFYLMMAVVIISGFSGSSTIATILGIAITISWVLGTSFRKYEITHSDARLISPRKEVVERKAA